MEICHGNSSSSASVDSPSSCLAMGRQTQLSPLSSAPAFLAPAFNACIHPQDAFDLDPALLRYSRSSADGFLSPTMDPSKLIRRRHYLRSLSSSRGSSPSPLSPIENLQTPPSRSPPVFKATTPPSKVAEGEEVLVMDGILVNSPSPTGINRSSSTRTADSSGSSGGSGLYKTEICRSWEDAGICRYGTKCQFAHGKEELRPARHPRNKSSEIYKSSSTTAGACALATKNRHVYQAPDQAFMSEAEEMIGQALQLGPDAVESYIRHLLFGHSQKPRLPVFTEICAEGEANLRQRQSQLPDSFPIIM